MKKMTALLALILVPTFVASSTLDCTPAVRRDVAKTALDLLQIGCIIANAHLGDVKWVQTTCQISDVLMPDLERIVSETKSAAKKEVASHASACSGAVSDAGVSPIDGGKK